MGPIIISRDWLPSHTQTDGQTDRQRDRGLPALLDRRLTYHLQHRPTGVRPALRDSRSNRAARQPINYIDKTAPFDQPHFSRAGSTPFSGQFRRQCMHFGNSAGNFGGLAVRWPVGHDSAAAMSKLVALLPNYMQIVQNWSEKGVCMGDMY